MNEERQKGRARRWALWGLCALAIGIAALALWRSGLLEKINSLEEVQTLIAKAGPFAGVVYFVIQLLTVIFAPIPSNVSMLAGALVMGFWPALLLGIAAVWCGSMLVFLAARRLGQRRVQGWVDHGVMEKYLPVIREKQGMFLFLALLLPFFPDDVLCILAGLTTIPTAYFAVIMLLARPWGLTFAALVGCGLLDLPVWGWALMLAALAAGFVLAMKYSAAIENKLLEWISKLGRGKKS